MGASVNCCREQNAQEDFKREAVSLVSTVKKITVTTIPSPAEREEKPHLKAEKLMQEKLLKHERGGGRDPKSSDLQQSSPVRTEEKEILFSLVEADESQLDEAAKKELGTTFPKHTALDDIDKNFDLSGMEMDKDKQTRSPKQGLLHPHLKKNDCEQLDEVLQDISNL